jgi:hypothetical protein
MRDPYVERWAAHHRDALGTPLRMTSLASTIGCPLIPDGRYTHLAWLRTMSDTVSSLGTASAISLCP